MTHNVLIINQQTFRFGIDETSESGHGFLATESSDITAGDEAGTDIGFDTNFLLRIRAADVSAGASGNNTTFELQVSKNSGTFANVTTSSSDVIAAASAVLTDGGDTTERLVGGTATFLTTNAGVSEDGTAAGANWDFIDEVVDYGELLWVIQVVGADVADTDTLDFRITSAGGTLMGNESTADEPRVTVDKVVAAGGSGEGPKIASKLGTSNLLEGKLI